VDMRGDGVMRLIGSPRHYIYSDIDHTSDAKWHNVEMSAFVWLPDGKFTKSYSGFALATRSNHQNYKIDPCAAATYSLKLRFDSGAIGFAKEFHHGSTSASILFANDRYVPRALWPGPLLVTEQFVGLKLMIQTRADLSSVRLRAFVDTTSNAIGSPQWELIGDITDTGTWSVSPKKFTPGVDLWPCRYPFTPHGVQDYSTPLLDAGRVSVLRTDGVNELLVKHARIIEIDAEGATKRPPFVVTATKPDPWKGSWTAARQVNSGAADPLDERVVMRGNGKVDMRGDGILRLIGSPRHYIYSDIDHTSDAKWHNVEISAFVWLPDGKFTKSFSGFALATRSNHHLFTDDGCAAATYSLKLRFDSGAIGFAKEFHHGSTSASILFANDRYVPRALWPGPLLVTNQFVGIKLVVQTRADLSSVRLRAFVDTTSNAIGSPQWELIGDITDTGTWSVSPKKFTPGVDLWPCRYPFTPHGVPDYSTPLLDAGRVSFLRTDGVNELLVKKASVVEIGPETSA
jgi:hypothetical protein